MLGIALLVETYLAHKPAFAQRTRRFLRLAAEAKVAQKVRAAVR